jgi:beta-mannosidase
VSNLLVSGEQNEIKIVFTPVDEVLGERVDELAGWKEKRVFMRKPQYNFGWDWALPMPGVGVFGYVKIEYDYEYEIIDYSVKTTLSGRLDFDFEVSPNAYERGYEIEVKVFGHGEEHSFTINRKQHRTYGHVLLKNPKLWWPNGYGEQPLYDYKIALLIEGKKVQEITGKIGIKQVEFLEEPFTKEAGDGYSFWLIVNGERVFIKGGNWIPMELWPGKIDERDYEFQIKMSKFANFNMLRV